MIYILAACERLGGTGFGSSVVDAMACRPGRQSGAELHADECMPRGSLKNENKPLDSKKATKNAQLLDRVKEKQRLIAAVGRIGSVCMFWAR
jgi:hypothetical protein